MILDSSAVVAVLRKEPEAREFADLMLRADSLKLSSATYVELVNVIDRRIGPTGLVVLDQFLQAIHVEQVPFTERQAVHARHARVTYGAGRHEAALNFGDCFAYALAKETGEPLLYKGDDFSRTDVPSAFPA